MAGRHTAEHFAVQSPASGAQEVTVHVNPLGEHDERLLPPGEAAALLAAGPEDGSLQIRKDISGLGDVGSFQRFARGESQGLSEEAQIAGLGALTVGARRGAPVSPGREQLWLDRRDLRGVTRRPE
jgi:hypothetical protein